MHKCIKNVFIKWRNLYLLLPNVKHSVLKIGSIFVKNPWFVVLKSKKWCLKLLIVDISSVTRATLLLYCIGNRCLPAVIFTWARAAYLPRTCRVRVRSNRIDGPRIIGYRYLLLKNVSVYLFQLTHLRYRTNIETPKSHGSYFILFLHPHNNISKNSKYNSNVINKEILFPWYVFFNNK